MAREESAVKAVRESLDLLSSRDRRRLILVACAQMSTSFLDLLGVALIGLTTAFAVSISTGDAPPATIQSLVDGLGFQGVPLPQLVLGCALAAGVLLIFKSGLSFYFNRRIIRFLATRTAMVSARLTAELLSRPLLEIQRRTSQQTAYALTTGVTSAVLLVLSQAIVVASEATLLIILCLGLIAVSPVVAMFSIVFFALVFVFIHKMLAQWAQRLGRRLTDADIGSIVAVQEALLTYRESFVGYRRNVQVQRIQDLRWETATVSGTIQLINMTPKYVLEVALVVGASALTLSQFLTKGVVEAVGLIVVFLAAASRIIPSLLRLQAAGLGIRQANGAAVRAFDLDRDLAEARRKERHSDVDDTFQLVGTASGSWRDHESFLPEVQVHGVSFRYSDSESFALQDVSFTIPAGASLALVGSTGSGKTTLSDVLLGVVRADTGYVTISGLRPDLAIRRWPGAMAYVPQDVALVSGTVRENIALGLPADAFREDELWDALRKARLDDFLSEFREGLDTTIGEHGVKLSGGQRQRLGIARALLTRPKLIVLDEATSALDAVTEREVSTMVESMGDGVTRVIIAHRLATVRNCDAVCYLDGGRIAGIGTFDQVRRLSSAFDEQATLLGL